jgi:hypothetical protein
MATKRLAIVAALVALLGIGAMTSATAYANNCTTTCYRSYNGQSTCNTNCW